MKNKPCILIVGHGRHGKDSLAEAIGNCYGLRFRGSSDVAAKEIVYPMMSNFYKDHFEAFERRHENRELWAAVIRDYNREDPTRLARKVCERGFGYTGLRDIKEVKACLKDGVFTHVIWVERPDIPQDDVTLTFSYIDLMALHSEFKNFKLKHIKNMYKGHLDELVFRGDLDEFLFND